MTAAQLHRRLLDAVGDSFADRAADLYAPDARVEIPFAPDGDRIVDGSAAVRTRFRDARRAGLSVRVDDVVLLPSADPHLSVAEFGYTWTSPGRPAFTTRNIQVLEERGGLAVATRDYHDHPAIGRGLRGSAGDVAARMHAAFNERDLDAVDHVFTADFISHPLGGAGRDEVRRRWSAMIDVDPTLQVSALSSVGDDRIAAVHSVVGGDRTPERQLFEFVRIEGGKISELWGAAT